MDHSDRHHRTCVVVADERAARYFLRPYKGAPLTEAVDRADAADLLERRHAPVAGTPIAYRGVRLSSASQREAAESAFLHRIAAQIDSLVAESSDQDLVLCAPPRALCLLRDYIAPQTRQQITCELSVDLVQADLPQIERYIGHLKT